MVNNDLIKRILLYKQNPDVVKPLSNEELTEALAAVIILLKKSKNE